MEGFHAPAVAVREEKDCDWVQVRSGRERATSARERFFIYDPALLLTYDDP
jgi:hypothetical protein